MKAYITCPVTHSKKRLDLLESIRRVVEEKGINTFVFEIGGTPEDIFDLDYREIRSSELIIAEVSEPSHGVGVEIGLSYGLGLKRILLFEKGNKISSMLRGFPETFLIEYENEKCMMEKLGSVLEDLDESDRLRGC